MANSAPLIDRRTEKEIAQQVIALINAYTGDWPRFDPSTSVSGALVGIFSRYASLVIQRLNRAPDKNFLAFLDLLGASLLPPDPARAPLTFFLAPGSTGDAMVPAGTQVAAPPAEVENNPILFETERPLVVTAARLVSLFVSEPQKDSYADQGGILVEPATSGVPAFSGNRLVEHFLSIGHDSLLAYPAIKELQINVTLAQTLPAPVDPRSIQWEIWNGAQKIVVTPFSDGTNQLSQSASVAFRDLPQLAEEMIAGKTSRWLRARLMTPITPSANPQAGMVRIGQLPAIQSLSMQATIDRKGLPIEAVFSNLLAVDASKDFFPFGEKPRFGDVLYLASREAFSQPGATITLHIQLTGQDSGLSLPQPDPNRRLAFEFWNGITWAAFTVTDGTSAFTKNGDVILGISGAPVSGTVNGLTSSWMRVRLSAGDYGKEAHYTPVYDSNSPPNITGYNFVPATFTPPSIKSISVDYVLTRTEAPDGVLTYNDFGYSAPAGIFAPFRPVQDTNPSFYLGFSLPQNRPVFPNRTLSLYFRLAEILYGQTADNPAPALPPRLVWEYWNGAAWIRLVVNDETEALTHSGLVELLPPADFQPLTCFGRFQYWLRVRWESGEYKFLPGFCAALPNTTMATQVVTITNEGLGSSNGSENQAFYTTRTPVVKGPQLQVREPEQPSAEEKAKIEEEEGEDAISMVEGTAGRLQAIWVRWHQVPDFFASGPLDRHYMLDYLTGEIRFGDGVNGRIPPIGTGNIRLARYQTGGGVRGNRAAMAIVQLKTTIPFIDKVTNYDAASGGAEAEVLDSLINRAPRTIRHRDRAVTIEDYEDLAMLASPEVARARCIPLYDLSIDPDAVHRLPGTVSLMIVPRSTGLKPLLNLKLIDRLKTYLDAHRILTAELVIVGPDYVRVDVDADIAPVSLDGVSAIEMAAEAALVGFLHPLTGGPDGAGWSFGRRPYESDLYVLLESIPGVDHVSRLKVTTLPDRAGADNTDRFLVYAGLITIHCVFEGS